MRLTRIADALTQAGIRRPAVYLRGTLASHRVRALFNASFDGAILGVSR